MAETGKSVPSRSEGSALHKSLNILLKAAEVLLGGDPATLSGSRSAAQLGRKHKKVKVRSKEGGTIRKEANARHSEGRAKGTAGQETPSTESAKSGARKPVEGDSGPGGSTLRTREKAKSPPWCGHHTLLMLVKWSTAGRKCAEEPRQREKHRSSQGLMPRAR